MNKLTFIVILVVGFSAICRAQQKSADTAKVRFSPPVIVKDAESSRPRQKKDVKFVQPVIVKDKPVKNKKAKKEEPVRFAPPTIVKDPDNR